MRLQRRLLPTQRLCMLNHKIQIIQEFPYLINSVPLQLYLKNLRRVDRVRPGPIKSETHIDYCQEHSESRRTTNVVTPLIVGPKAGAKILVFHVVLVEQQWREPSVQPIEALRVRVKPIPQCFFLAFCVGNIFRWET